MRRPSLWLLPLCCNRESEWLWKIKNKKLEMREDKRLSSKLRKFFKSQINEKKNLDMFWCYKILEKREQNISKCCKDGQTCLVVHSAFSRGSYETFQLGLAIRKLLLFCPRVTTSPHCLFFLINLWLLTLTFNWKFSFLAPLFGPYTSMFIIHHRSRVISLQSEL